MNKKLIILIILILLLIFGGVFWWWQNDKNTAGNIEENKENSLIPIIETVEITGKVMPPSNIKPESLTIVTLGETTVIDTKGNFCSDVHKEGVTLVAAMPQHKDFGLMNVVVTSKNNSDTFPIIDSKTTAESMVFITPYFLTSHSQKANEILEVIRNDTKVNILAEVINDVFDKEDPLGNSNLQEAFKNAVESVINKLSYQQSIPLSSKLDKNNSGYKIIRLPERNADQNFLYQKIFSFAQADTKRWQPAIIQPDPDYMQINISQNEESCNISAESKEIGAVDWICELSNINKEGLDITEFYEKAKDNRTTYQSENFNGSGNIGTIYVKAKGVFKYIDYMSYIVDNVSDKIFGKKTKHTFNIPINDDGIYLVRCYSGGWGILTNDPNERSFIGQQAKFYDTKQNRTNDALVSNVAMIFFDGMNVLIRYDSLPLGDVSEILMAGLMIDSSEIVISESLQTKDDLFRTFYRVVTQVSENMVKRTAKAIKAEISRNLFFGLGRMGKMVVRIAWPIDKIIAGGQIADRANQMITIATPLETSYIIVGNPLLEEELSKKEKGNYKEAIINGTFLEPPGNFKIKYLDTIWRLNKEEENFPKLEHKTINCEASFVLDLSHTFCLSGGPGCDFLEEQTELNLNNKNFKRDIKQIKNGKEIMAEYYFNSSELFVFSNQNNYKQCISDFEEVLKTLEFTEAQEKQEEQKETEKVKEQESSKEINEEFSSIIYVPDNYLTIQSAIDSASVNATIIVRDGTYVENINISKPNLTIKSENGHNSTIIQSVNSNDKIFYISANNITIDGFTIKGNEDKKTTNRNYKTGIHLDRTSCCKVLNNDISNYKARGIDLSSSLNTDIRNNIIISNNGKYTNYYHYGVHLSSSSKNNICDNKILDNGQGIYLGKSSDNNITRNEIGDRININNGYNIYLSSSPDNNINNNNLSDGHHGIYLSSSSDNNINNNKLSKHGTGITLREANNNIITNNDTSSGIYIYGSSSIQNEIYLNNFLNSYNNVHSVYNSAYVPNSLWNSASSISYTYNGNIFNNCLGNYWSDYEGTDTNKDGIGDTPHKQGDNYPLMQPFENYKR